MKKIIGSILGVFSMLLIAYGVYLKTQGAVASVVIGGADGPTSIFLAGRVGNELTAGLLVFGIVLLVIAVFLLRKKK